MICPDQKLSGQIFYYYIISPFVFNIFILFQSANLPLYNSHHSHHQSSLSAIHTKHNFPKRCGRLKILHINYLFRKTTKKYQIYTRQLSFSFSHYSTTGLVLSIRQYLLSTSTYYQHKASVKYLFH